MIKVMFFLILLFKYSISAIVGRMRVSQPKVFHDSLSIKNKFDPQATIIDERLYYV
jgi:hypothetical protein